MNKEDYFVNHFAKNKFIGDDAAVLGSMCVSQDAFFEDVHFKRKWMSLYKIAQKAMLVNISDAIVMNAHPKYALISVAIPAHYTREELKELAMGFKQTASRYGIEIIGGDTISNSKLDISITIIAKCNHPILRSGIKEGDLLAFTGKLGQSRKDLNTLLRGGHVSSKSRFITPLLRDRFFFSAARHIKAAMDISDGLFFDLEKLHRANNIGFDFLYRIPKSIGCSGEEFEVLFAFDPSKEEAIMRLAKRTRTPVNIFAKAVRKNYINYCKPHHF